MEKVKGLRTQEPPEFVDFMCFVQTKAKEQGKVFFLDSEDGNDIDFDNMLVCDLSGWLLPIEKSNEFEVIWKVFEEDDAWADYFCFIECMVENEKLKIEFKFYS